MPSIQDRLESSSLKIRQKLWDNQIHLMGQETSFVRLKIVEDMYGDETASIVSHDTITAYLAVPGDVPLFRSRADNFGNEIDSNTGIFLFDIIPSELYTKWTDNVEMGDILASTFKDENGKSTTMIWKVSNIVGQFKSSLIYKKCFIAPYNGTLTDEMKSYLGVD